MYTARIHVPGDPKLLMTLFQPELHSYERSSITLQSLQHGIVFIIKATDATALRSTLHGITKLLQTLEALRHEK